VISLFRAGPIYSKHVKKTGHNRTDTAIHTPRDGPDLRTRECAALPTQYHHDEEDLDDIDPSSCVVCSRHFNTKRQFFAHLGGGHYRGPIYVQKDKAELYQETKSSKKEKRLVDWIRKDVGVRTEQT
jgi:hypothetical protein